MSGKTRRLNGKSWVIVIKVLKSILAVFMLLSIVGRAMTSRRHDAYGNENWEFNDDGLMRLRLACINDLRIREADRKYYWPLGRRPDDHPGLRRGAEIFPVRTIGGPPTDS